MNDVGGGEPTEPAITPARDTNETARSGDQGDASSARRADSLADAGDQATSGIDETAAISSVVRAALPSLADYCLIDLVDEHGQVRRVATAHVDPTREALAAELRRYPTDLNNASSIVAEALRTGQPAVTTLPLDEWLEQIAQEAEHRRLPRALAPAALLAVPLRARGHTLGALIFFRAIPAPRYTPADIALAEDLAHLAALALGNAHLLDEVRAAEVRYRSLFEGIGDAILVMDEARRIVEANRAASDLLGYTLDELRHRPMATLIADDTWHDDMFGQVRATGAGRAEGLLRTKDGRTTPVESTVSTMALPRGALYLAIHRDISRRRALERLQREFLAAVTHELKTPLTGLRAYAQLMRRRGVYSERAVDTIVAQTQTLGRLIDDLLDVSRLEAGQLDLRRQRLDLLVVVAGAVDAARPLSSRHDLRLEAPAGPVPVVGDGGRLAQVMHHLLTNAIKYAPAGGEIAVAVRRDGGQALVSVRDHGAGVPPEAMPRLFERFYRTEAARGSHIEGLGLGLTICKGLVEAHGGRIWAESTLGEGSTFTFALATA